MAYTTTLVISKHTSVSPIYGPGVSPELDVNRDSASYVLFSTANSSKNCYSLVAKYIVPAWLMKKSIKKVTITYTHRTSNSVSGYWNVRSETIKPCIFDDEYFSYFNYANFSAYANIGEGITYESFYNAVNGASVTRDITGIFANNVSNGKFAVAFCGIDASISNSAPNVTAPEDFYIFVYSDPTITVEYEDIVPAAPTLREPIDQYVSQEEDTRFEWVYSSLTNFPQYSVEIGWRKQGEPNYNTITKITSETYNYIAKNVFPTGTIEYRLRTTDTDGNVSDYSYAKFYVKTKPQMATITSITNSALCEIRWNSVDQAAYEISLYKDTELLYTEKVNSFVNVYKPKMFLEDGTYTFKINVMNGYMLWSGEASKIFTISTTKPSKPSIIATVDGTKVRLKINSSVSTNYVYRVQGGVETCIGMTNDELEDNSAVIGKIAYYYVRAVSTGYTDSDKIQCMPRADGIILSSRNHYLNIKKSIERYMSFSESSTRDKRLIQYLGRKNPVREQSEFVNHTISRTFFIDSNIKDEIIEMALSDDVVLYRDKQGNKMYCDISIDNIKNDLLDTGYAVSVVLTEIDYSEEVEINA